MCRERFFVKGDILLDRSRNRKKRLLVGWECRDNVKNFIDEISCIIKLFLSILKVKM